MRYGLTFLPTFAYKPGLLHKADSEARAAMAKEGVNTDRSVLFKWSDTEGRSERPRVIKATLAFADGDAKSMQVLNLWRAEKARLLWQAGNLFLCPLTFVCTPGGSEFVAWAFRSLGICALKLCGCAAVRRGGGQFELGCVIGRSWEPPRITKPNFKQIFSLSEGALAVAG